MFNKVELIGIGASIMAMVAAVWLVRLETVGMAPTLVDSGSQQASAGLQVVSGDDPNRDESLRAAVAGSVDRSGRVTNLIIDDVEPGTGRAVERGDTVTVHYIGTLPNGQEFDNSRSRGTPFTFRVGRGNVIQGWEEGVVGMREGGKRILVIPPEKAYGPTGFGPIPPNATLVFAIELLEVR